MFEEIDDFVDRFRFQRLQGILYIKIYRGVPIGLPPYAYQYRFIPNPQATPTAQSKNPTITLLLFPTHKPRNSFPNSGQNKYPSIHPFSVATIGEPKKWISSFHPLFRRDDWSSPTSISTVRLCLAVFAESVVIWRVGFEVIFLKKRTYSSIKIGVLSV